MLPTRVHEERQETIRELRSRGLTAPEIAKVTGLTPPIIYRYSSQAPKNVHTVIGNISPTKRDIILDMLRNKHSIMDIAKAVGVKYTTVSGIRFRYKSEEATRRRAEKLMRQVNRQVHRPAPTQHGLAAAAVTSALRETAASTIQLAPAPLATSTTTPALKRATGISINIDVSGVTAEEFNAAAAKIYKLLMAAEISSIEYNITIKA